MRGQEDVSMKVKREVGGELKELLLKGGKYVAFVEACERIGAEEGNWHKVVDAAIEEVAPNLRRFKFSRKSKSGRVRDAKCNGFKLLEWVVENYDVEDVEREDAPSLAAWAILQAARKDDDVHRDVLKKYLDSRIKLDAAQGDTDTRKMDGQAEYDILEGLEAKEFA